MYVISVAEYAETEEMQKALRRYDRIRVETLSLLWGDENNPAIKGIPDFAKASADTKAFIYDEAKKAVERMV